MVVILQVGVQLYCRYELTRDRFLYCLYPEVGCPNVLRHGAQFCLSVPGTSLCQIADLLSGPGSSLHHWPLAYYLVVSPSNGISSEMDSRSSSLGSSSRSGSHSGARVPFLRLSWSHFGLGEGHFLPCVMFPSGLGAVWPDMDERWGSNYIIVLYCRN